MFNVRPGGARTVIANLKWLPFRASMAAACIMMYSALSIGQEPAASNILAQAAKLYDLQEFSELQILLNGINEDDLEADDRIRLLDYRERNKQAIAGSQAAVLGFNLAVVKMIKENYAQAKEALQGVLNNPYSPVELRISARARLARIRLIERKQAKTHRNQARPSASLAQPDPASAGGAAPKTSNDPVLKAKELVERGMNAIDRGDYDQAQQFFNLAILQVPDAPREMIRVEPYGAVELRNYPVNVVEQVEIVEPPRVRINANIGIGRLIAVNSFQFSGGPRGGVGAPGFVQLPIVQRTQIKTTASVPAGLITGRRRTFVRDYLILTRPKL